MPLTPNPNPDLSFNPNPNPTQAAVAFARFMSSAPSSDSFGNMVVEPPLPESTKEEGINTIDKILDSRIVTVDCLEPAAVHSMQTQP